MKRSHSSSRRWNAKSLPFLVESELNRKLTQLLDDVQKIGLTVDSYLQSKGLTMERLKEQYTREITDMYKLEFILLDIADKESWGERRRHEQAFS